MLLKSLTLENIRIYRGVNTINLTPVITEESHKPIILIGGKNGAGKTTFFESILLCLYGQNAPGSRLSKAKYERHIEHMVAKQNNNQKAQNPAIEVVFEFTHSGEKHTYDVRREWNVNPKFIEKLTVMRDGEELSDLEADQWQDLLNELIPPRFARLFLFDGEKIQSLVEDSRDNIYLRDSFKSLLGLDIVERLKADLRIYISQHLKGKEIEKITDKLNATENQLKENLAQKEKFAQDRAQLQTNYDRIQGEIERQEQQLAMEGGSFARKREELKNEKIRLDNDIIRIEGKIRDLCTGLFPFAITPEYCSLLKERLIQEDAIQTHRRSQDVIKSGLQNLDRVLQLPEFWSDVTISSQEKEKMISKFSDLMNQEFALSINPKEAPLIHHLSQFEFHKLLHWIDDSTNIIPGQMEGLSNQLENLTAKRQKVVEMINRAPADEIIAPLIHKLNEKNQLLGQISEKIRSLDARTGEVDFRITTLERQVELVNEEIQNVKHGSIKIELAQQVTSILNEYATELQKQKITQLSDNILSCFSRLLRKEDYVKDILIDDNFRITLFGQDGTAIPQELLSAGEKEIFAVSLLWALTLTSERQLPFVIDTPLGRLDSEHRGNLVMDFFQHAGDQMIILSTDTEIDKEYFRVLQPHIARAYHLDYSTKERCTSISPGYFWKSKDGEVEV